MRPLLVRELHAPNATNSQLVALNVIRFASFSTSSQHSLHDARSNAAVAKTPAISASRLLLTRDELCGDGLKTKRGGREIRCDENTTVWLKAYLDLFERHNGLAKSAAKTAQEGRKVIRVRQPAKLFFDSSPSLRLPNSKLGTHRQTSTQRVRARISLNAKHETCSVRFPRKCAVLRNRYDSPGKRRAVCQTPTDCLLRGRRQEETASSVSPISLPFATPLGTFLGHVASSWRKTPSLLSSRLASTSSSLCRPRRPAPPLTSHCTILGALIKSKSYLVAHASSTESSPRQTLFYATRSGLIHFRLSNELMGIRVTSRVLWLPVPSVQLF